nr:MAG TPA: hypothetical protein [Caudoviricetes sp.]
MSILFTKIYCIFLLFGIYYCLHVFQTVDTPIMRCLYF